MPKEHPKNAPGDFYVEFDCCTTCDVPMQIAPDLFAYDDAACFVRKQPGTDEELRRMIEVMENQELGCIRYRGKNPEVLPRLYDVFCDYVRVGDARARRLADDVKRQVPDTGFAVFNRSVHAPHRRRDWMRIFGLLYWVTLAAALVAVALVL